MGVDARGAALARRIADALGDAEVHGLRARVPVAGAGVPVAGVGIPVANVGVPVTGAGVPVAGARVPVAGAGVSVAGAGVPENDAGTPEANGSAGAGADVGADVGVGEKDDPITPLHRHRGADVGFDETARHVRALFEAGRPIVGVCAAGILVRAVAPALDDKRAEPPLVAVSEDSAKATGSKFGCTSMAGIIPGGIGRGGPADPAGSGSV